MEHTISAAQFFAVQFLIRVTMTIALDPSAIAGENPLNTLFSYGLAMVLGAGLAVPVWLLHRQPGMAFGSRRGRPWVLWGVWWACSTFCTLWRPTPCPWGRFWSCWRSASTRSSPWS